MLTAKPLSAEKRANSLGLFIWGKSYIGGEHTKMPPVWGRGPSEPSSYEKGQEPHGTKFEPLAPEIGGGGSNLTSRKNVLVGIRGSFFVPVTLIENYVLRDKRLLPHTKREPLFTLLRVVHTNLVVGHKVFLTHTLKKRTNLSMPNYINLSTWLDK